MDNLVRLARFTVLPLPVIAALILQAQIGVPKDPGPRQGAPGEGAMIIGLTGAERELFRKGWRHLKPSALSKAIVSCRKRKSAWAHVSTWTAVRAVTPTLIRGNQPLGKPASGRCRKRRGANRIPVFVKTLGPVLQTRFRFFPDGSRDGGVHALFTISGRRDASGCQMAQPDFDRELSRANVSFRIPTRFMELA